MSGYQAPAFDDLCKSARNLSSEYKEKNNSARNEETALLRTLADRLGKESSEVMLGAWLFVHEDIQAEYDAMSYSSLPYFGSPEWSELFRLSNKTLEIHAKNKLDPATIFIGLIALLNYVELNKGLVSDNLLKKIQSTAEKAKAKLPLTFYDRLPTARALEEGCKELPNRYAQICAQDSFLTTTPVLSLFFGRSSKRTASIAAITQIDQRCDDESKKMSSEENYHTRLTAATLQMWQIEQEYVRAPENSDLYKELQRLTNLNKSAELMLEVKPEYITDTIDFLNTEMKARLASQKTEDSQNKELADMKNDITRWQRDLKRTQHNVKFNNQQLERVVNTGINLFASSAAKTGVLFAALRMAAFLSSNYLDINLLFNLASPQNRLFMMMALWVLKKGRTCINAMIMQSCTSLVKPVVRAPASFVSWMTQTIRHVTATPPTAEDLRLAHALNEAPLSIVSKEEKEKLNRLFDLKEVEPAQSKEEIVNRL